MSFVEVKSAWTIHKDSLLLFASKIQIQAQTFPFAIIIASVSSIPSIITLPLASGKGIDGRSEVSFRPQMECGDGDMTPYSIVKFLSSSVNLYGIGEGPGFA